MAQSGKDTTITPIPMKLLYLNQGTEGGKIIQTKQMGNFLKGTKARHCSNKIRFPFAMSMDEI